MTQPNINEVRNRLRAFAKQFQNTTSEKSMSQTFWLRFYECFGIRAESASIYEQQVKKLDKKIGFIDSFIPGKLIIEQKSKGKSLDAAYNQASEYFMSLKEAERPRYIITSDFSEFQLHDLQEKTQHSCTLEELAENAEWFLFLQDKDREIVEESPINRQAAEAVAELHEALLQSNFKGRDLEVFLTRLLFCFFADDTGIFGENRKFENLLRNKTKEDGSNTGSTIQELYEILDTDHPDRQKALDEDLASFSYINGSLFSEKTKTPFFDSDMRKLLMNCAVLNWKDISPAIFGAMFQGILEAHNPTASRQATRRELGAHYTSERNILKVINPLFMDDLRKELAQAKTKDALQKLYDKLPTLKFFDPACGCGNFLVIAYRELRKLENELIEKLFKMKNNRGLLDVSTLCRVKLEQFYGIEIDEAAVHIARVAMWITDHQMNLESSVLFGTTRPTIPLKDSANIVHGNALRTDWEEVLPAKDCSFIMGNPPFIGYTFQNIEQKADLKLLFSHLQGGGVLDYVCGWYAKSALYLNSNNIIQCAFVSTNSITQGEQPAILWKFLLTENIVINFAHRTFRWSNEGRGIAAVHCVIIGFSKHEKDKKYIYEYPDIRENPNKLEATYINAYLVDAKNILLSKNKTHISNNAPLMFRGNQPTDGGHLLLNDIEKEDIIKKNPKVKPFIKKFLMGDELINGTSRWCLWLPNIQPNELTQMPEVLLRIEKVREMRRNSSKEATRKIASTPYLFGEIKQPKDNYLALPIVSSERREYMPIAFLDKDIICGNKLYCVPNAKYYHFALLTSSMHMAWMRSVCGRLESRYSYSNTIVYNNFPFPNLTAKIENTLSKVGEAILSARDIYPTSTLANLYNPLTMPVELLKAHIANNKAVDAAYGYKGKDDDASRVAFLFKLYEEQTKTLLTESKKGKKVSKKKE